MPEIPLHMRDRTNDPSVNERSNAGLIAYTRIPSMVRSMQMAENTRYAAQVIRRISTRMYSSDAVAAALLDVAGSEDAVVALVRHQHALGVMWIDHRVQYQLRAGKGECHLCLTEQNFHTYVEQRGETQARFRHICDVCRYKPRQVVDKAAQGSYVRLQAGTDLEICDMCEQVAECIEFRTAVLCALCLSRAVARYEDGTHGKFQDDDDEQHDYHSQYPGFGLPERSPDSSAGSGSSDDDEPSSQKTDSSSKRFKSSGRPVIQTALLPTCIGHQQLYVNYDASQPKIAGMQEFVRSYHVTHPHENIVLHLIDSGSTCFLSPRKEHFFIEHVCQMKIKGVGSETCDTMSPLIYTFLDMNNDYQSFQWPAVYYTTAVGFPIMATGPMEKQGFTFILHSRNAHIISPTGTGIPILTDPTTGFHWAVERLAAAPTVEGKSRLIAAFLKHPQSAGVKLKTVPTIPQNPYIEQKPTIAPTSFDYDSILQAASHIHFAIEATGEGNMLEAEKQKQVCFPITRAQKSNQKQTDEMTKFKEVGGVKNDDTEDVSAVTDSDSEYFRKARNEWERKARRPLRIRLPMVRAANTDEVKSMQKLKTMVHETFGHLPPSTLRSAVKRLPGSSLLKHAFGKDEDGSNVLAEGNCDSCSVAKSRVAPAPKGKTVRIEPLKPDDKVYVDLSGKINEPSFRHKYQYYIALVKPSGFVAVGGLTFRSQSLMCYARTCAQHKLKPKEIQIDGEGALNCPVARNFFTSQRTKWSLVEASHHYRNGKVERKHDTLKSTARAMIERSGLHLCFWYFAIQHAALVTNLILPARGELGEEMPMTIWEAEYGAEPDIERYLLGPFGCLSYLILTEEQRRAKGLCKHFGIRSIAGIYLGCTVDVNGTYRHLVCDGLNIFTSPSLVRVIADVYPMRLQKMENGIPRPMDMVQDKDNELNLGVYYAAWQLARVEKEKTRQAEAMFAISNGTLKPSKTRLLGDERRTGSTKANRGRVISEKIGGETIDSKMEFNSIDYDAEICMEDPKSYGMIELAPPEFRFEKLYEGAKYEVAVAVDFSNEDIVPKDTVHSHRRFIGRLVRKLFQVKPGLTLKPFEGEVKSFSEDRSLFKIIFSDADKEEWDLQELMDHLVMSKSKGDPDEDDGWTRQEKMDALYEEAVHLIFVEEAFYGKDTTLDEYKGIHEMSENYLAHQIHEAFVIDKSRAVIYDDEPRWPSEVMSHPERQEIEQAAKVEMQQLNDMQVGRELTQAQLEDVRRRGVRILRSKMIYKRKYEICPIDKKEYFKKWKARLAVIGCAETAGIDTLWSTFSPTIGFAAIRLMIALVANLKFVTESYDLSGAFLGTKLEDQEVYVELPKDAGRDAGKVLLLSRAVYGTKASGRRFIDALAEKILSFKSSTKGIFRRLLMDMCIYVYQDEKGNTMYMLNFVDDLILASTSIEMRDEFIKHLNKSWNVTLEGQMRRFLGIHFSQEELSGKWKATMGAYIDRISKRFALEDTRLVETPLEPGFTLCAEDFAEVPSEQMISLYRSLIGSVGYCAVALRYDVAYAVSVLSRHLARPCQKAVMAARRVIRYLVHTRDFEVAWWIDAEDMNAGSANILFGAADTGFGMCPITRRSHGGYMNFLNNGVISYKSKLQPSVTLSSAEAEYMGLADEAQEIVYLRKLLEEIGFPQVGATLIWEDNKAAILAAEGETSSAGRMKHVDIKFRFIAEKIKQGVIRVRYRPTDLNYADLMTKSLTPLKHRNMIILCSSHKSEPALLIIGNFDREEKNNDAEIDDESYMIVMD